MSSREKSSFTKAASDPLLRKVDGGGPTSHPVYPSEWDDSSSEITRMSWGRAIGVCNLYIVWLIFDLLGLWGGRNGCCKTEVLLFARHHTENKGKKTSCVIIPFRTRSHTSKYPYSLDGDPDRRAVALTALVTDYWIVPTGAALPFISNAGLWKVCFVPTATEEEGRAPVGSWGPSGLRDDTCAYLTSPPSPLPPHSETVHARCTT